jgi:MFS family permease
MAGDRQDRIYRRRDLPIYLGARFLTEAADLALSVAAGWTVYELSNAALALGIAGVVQFVPMVLLALPAGELCDRLSPRLILLLGLAFQGLCAAGFLTLMLLPSPGLPAFYAILLLYGAGRAFAEPAGQALLPLLIPPERLPRAIAWSASAWQLAVIAGPTLGGVAYAFGPGAAFTLCGIGFLAAVAGVAILGGRRRAPADTAELRDRIARLVEGMKFVWVHPNILGAISLDLFAVLFGGATALLPIYARDILDVGPIGLGLLRSAPAAGACVIAFCQVCRPLTRHAGPKLFASIAVFGIATLIFALSTSLALSLAALFVVGAGDMMSVNIRLCLVQLATPDTMRGRVSAVNMLFIGASSELGAFESGVTAALLGTVPAVVLGALGTLLVAVTWLFVFPSLRKTDRLSTMAPLEPPGLTL